MQEQLAPVISRNQTMVLSSNVQDRLARVRAAVADERQATSRLVCGFADKVREPRPDTGFADRQRP
jgi:hypothetical protein